MPYILKENMLELTALFQEIQLRQTTLPFEFETVMSPKTGIENKTKSLLKEKNEHFILQKTSNTIPPVNLFATNNICRAPIKWASTE